LAGIYLDDVPFSPSSPNSDSNGYLFDPDLADIERIEVLEGPQSTLYGASSMGGVLKFVTKQPDLNALSAIVRVDGSQVDAGGTGYGARGSANIPIITDKMALRASAFYRDDPGFVDNDFYGTKNVNHDSVKGARISLRVQFTDDLATTLSGFAQNVDNFAHDSAYLIPQTLRPVPGRLAYSSVFNQSGSIENRSLSDTTTLNLHFATLVNVASYAGVTAIRDNADLTPFEGFAVPPGFLVSTPATFRSRRFSDELRLVSSPGKIEWLLGGFYTHERDPDDIYFNGTDAAGVTLPPSSPYLNVFTYHNTSIFNEKAIFGDVTYHFTERLQGTVGMRYSHDDQSFNEWDDGIIDGGTLFTTVGSSKDSAETYLATVAYKPTSEMSVYLRAASAYRPGGPNIVDATGLALGAPATFGSDKLWNYEAGIKGSWAQRITYSLALYYMDWKNIQLNIFFPGYGTEVANASSAKSDGVEASLELAPIDGLTINLSAAYIDAKLTSPINDAIIGSPSGDRLPYSPRVAAASLLDYRWAALNGVVPRAGLTYAYHGSEVTVFTPKGGHTLPSYATLDLRGGIDWSRYSVIVRIDNITNEFGLIDAGGSPLNGIVIKPRTFGLSFSARF
jgi:outer membrane receptor protein involved in Fe transport